MFYAMESFKEGCTMYQRAVRIKPFATLEKAIQYAQKKARGKPFVCQGVKVVWAGEKQRLFSLLEQSSDFFVWDTGKAGTML